MSISDAPAPRKRNAAATREAILGAARTAFLKDSFDGVGVREVAAYAGVDPALVSRYFGSKSGLFRAVLSSFERPISLGGDVDVIAARLIDQLISESRSADTIDPLVLLLRSCSSPQALEEIRRYMQEDVLGPLATALGGANAQSRAATAVSLLMGLTAMRRILLSGPPEAGQKRKTRERLISLMKQALAE